MQSEKGAAFLKNAAPFFTERAEKISKNDESMMQKRSILMLENPVGKTAADSGLGNEFEHGFHRTLKQRAKLVQCVRGDVLSALHRIIVGQGESHLTQTIGCDTLLFHCPEQRFIAYHPQYHLP